VCSNRALQCCLYRTTGNTLPGRICSVDTLNKTEVRLISIRALEQMMTARRLNATTLSELTHRMFDRRSKIRPISRQIISHLLNNKRQTVSANTAAAIEEALEVPAGALFVVKVLPVSQDRQRAA